MRVVGALTRWVVLGCVLVLVACSSDQGGGTGGSGIDSRVVAVGTVTDVPTLTVAGIAFETADATILVNGQPGTAADLHVGQVVTVAGTRDPQGGLATARTVTFDRTAAGPIDSIQPATGSLVVLGQIVVVDPTTQFGATSGTIPIAGIADLVVGNLVEVSGFADATGALRATRLDKTQEAITPGFAIETTGTLSNLNTTTHTFTLNRLQVDFSTAQLRNLPGEQLVNGQVVEVTSTQHVVNGLLVAELVEGKNVGIPGRPGQRVGLEGIITSAAFPETFEVNGQTVQLTAATVFAEGGTRDALGLNVRVEIAGRFTAEGIVVAETVEIENDGAIELEGVITRVTSPDTFEVAGQVVRTTPDTVYTLGTAADLVVGTQLQVEGVFDVDGVFVASGIELFVDIQGLITRITAPNMFEVEDQGVRITVQLTPDIVFEGGTAADLALNVLVEVEGHYDETGVFEATAVEFLQ